MTIIKILFLAVLLSVINAPANASEKLVTAYSEADLNEAIQKRHAYFSDRRWSKYEYNMSYSDVTINKITENNYGWYIVLDVKVDGTASPRRNRDSLKEVPFKMDLFFGYRFYRNGDLERVRHYTKAITPEMHDEIRSELADKAVQVFPMKAPSYPVEAFYDTTFTEVEAHNGGVRYTAERTLSLGPGAMFERLNETTSEGVFYSIIGFWLGVLALLYVVLWRLIPGYSAKRRAIKASQHINKLIEGNIGKSLSEDELTQFFIRVLETFEGLRKKHLDRVVLPRVDSRFASDITDIVTDYRKFCVPTEGFGAPLPIDALCYHLAHYQNELNYYTNMEYLSGLSAPMRAGSHAVLFVIPGSYLLVYSQQLKKPVAKLTFNTIKSFARNLTSKSPALEIQGYDQMSRERVEMMFALPILKLIHDNGYIEIDKNHSSEAYNRFNTWLTSNVCEASVASGLSDEDIAAYGDHGEAIVERELQRLAEGKPIWYIKTGSLCHKDKYFEIDFLVFTPSRGFIVIEVKYYAGAVLVNGESVWKQTKHSETREQRNACLQAERARELLESILSPIGPDVPVTSLVVFSHPDAVISQEIGSTPPQCPVITLNMLEDSLWGRSTYEIDDKTLEQVKQTIEAHAKVYSQGE